MISDMIQRCLETHADMGILLYTNVDQSGFVLPNKKHLDIVPKKKISIWMAEPTRPRKLSDYWSETNIQLFLISFEI